VWANRFYRNHVIGTEPLDYETLLGRAGLLLRKTMPGISSVGAVQYAQDSTKAQIATQTRIGTPLYEAGLEGLVLFAILSFLFWRTQARYQPGKLVGAFIFFYGIFRFAIEFIREPDAQLTEFAMKTGLHMGQWLTVPMILGGLYLMATANKRRVRVEPTVGTASVA
jgi:phosphatidylglycerol:prolipoprotein diacylglycerol transferase